MRWQSLQLPLGISLPNSVSSQTDCSKLPSMRFLRPTRPLGAIRIPLIVGRPLPVYPDQDIVVPSLIMKGQQRGIFRALSYGGGGKVSWTHENLIRSSGAHISN